MNGCFEHCSRVEIQFLGIFAYLFAKKIGKKRTKRGVYNKKVLQHLDGTPKNPNAGRLMGKKLLLFHLYVSEN